METANLVLFNGTIFRSVVSGFAQAIALRGNKIAGVGTLDDLGTLIGPSTIKINLAGRAVVPGFNDSHQHPIWCGLDDLQIDLSSASSVLEIVQALAIGARSITGERWIVGVGYDQAKLREQRHPTADELQSAAPGRPVVAYRTCRHTAVASTVALALRDAHHGAHSRLSDGGRGDEDSQSGLLRESELESLARAMPPLQLPDLVNAIDRATQKCLRYGITSVTEAAVGMRSGMLELDAYRIARQDHRLNVRTELSLLAGPSGLDVELLLQQPLQGDEWLRTGAVKLFMDGAAGGGTARMTVPYLRGGAGADRRGLICLDEGYIRETVPRLIQAGKTIMTHAIGDEAIDRTLAMLTATPQPNFRERRHRIEHVTFARPDQIRQMSKLGVAVSVQPLVIRQSGDLYTEILGHERASRAIPVRSLIDAGLRPAASSDAPVSSIDPLENIRSMVARKTALGISLGAEQIVSIAEAIQCTTESAAYIGHREAQIGTLDVGKVADLAVLSANPFQHPDTINECVVDLTIADGKPAFDRHTELPIGVTCDPSLCDVR